MRYIQWVWLVVLSAAWGVSCAPRGDAPPPISQDKKANGKRPVVADLKEQVESALADIKARPLEPGHGFWTIFHAILGMGLDTELVVDHKTGERVKAIEYIAQGKNMPGLEFRVTPEGADVESAFNKGGGFQQGHQDQFIAEMAQWAIPPDMVFYINGNKETARKFMDFCKHSKMRASVKATPKQELSCAIIFVGEYFADGSLFKRNDAGEIEYLPWTNMYGEKLTYEDAVRYELNEPVSQDAACGGTHRLFGLTWAYHMHLARGGKTTGVWKDLADKIALFKGLAKKYQNDDGSFSIKYFDGRGEPGKEVGEQIASTGHILEWLALAMTDAELKEDWVQRAVRAQCRMVFDMGGAPAEGGALYHATHGLNLYYARVYGGKSDPRLRGLPLLP